MLHKNLCKTPVSEKIKQCQIYTALFQSLCEYTAWKVLIKYHFLHSWIQLLSNLKQASKNNKHTPITFTSSSVQPKRLIIKMAGFSHNQMAEKADTLKTMQNIKNLVGKSAEVIRMHIFGERWHPNFPFWARSPKRIFSNITFRREHITQIILHRISISHLSFCNFPFNSL